MSEKEEQTTTVESPPYIHGFSHCWNIWIDKREDCELIVLHHYMGARSLYIQEGRRDKGRKTAPPEPVLGDSVMSGRHLRSVISGRHLWTVISGRPLF